MFYLDKANKLGLLIPVHFETSTWFVLTGSDSWSFKGRRGAKYKKLVKSNAK